MDKFKFKKSLGQNFIQDKEVIYNMINNVDIDSDTLVIEIGPGAGVLSIEIVKKAGFLLLYEIDKSLDKILKEKLINFSNYNLIFNDFMKAKVEEDIKQYNYKKIYVIANLPYYITTPIINKLISSNINIDKMMVMVQKEVADRMTANVNSTDYGSFTLFLRTYFNLKRVLEVTKDKFYPVPKVDSTVVLMEKNDNIKKINNIKIFDKLIKDSFQFKRKNIKNNLKNYDLDKIETILNKYNLNLSSRAENIDYEVFVEIANNLN